MFTRYRQALVQFTLILFILQSQERYPNVVHGANAWLDTSGQCSSGSQLYSAPSLGALREAVKGHALSRRSADALRRVGSATHSSVEGQVRVLRWAVLRHIVLEILAQDILKPWLVWHADWLLTRF